jgi:SAM-dependent methyltransferase
MDIRAYNREAWNREVDKGESPWTKPVSPEIIAKARQGEWTVLLTENRSVPRDWFPPLLGLKILGLACGGGQQCPIFAAAGADVTVFDNSPRQLDRDREVAAREGLTNLRTVEGDMRDLSIFPDASFDLIFHPVSNVFIPNVRPVWREAYRVLRPGGALLAGFMNPVFYIFDFDKAEKGILEVKHRLPYADTDIPEMLARYIALGWPLEHSHSLDDQIGGQTDAGFHITGLYESRRDGVIGEHLPTYIATRAIKPGAIV